MIQHTVYELYVCKHICILDAHMQTISGCTHANDRMLHVCVSVFVYIYIYIYIYMNLINMHTFVDLGICINAQGYVHLYTCYMCVCIYIHRETTHTYSRHRVFSHESMPWLLLSSPLSHLSHSCCHSHSPPYYQLLPTLPPAAIS